MFTHFYLSEVISISSNSDMEFIQESTLSLIAYPCVYDVTQVI